MEIGFQKKKIYIYFFSKPVIWKFSWYHTETCSHYQWQFFYLVFKGQPKDKDKYETLDIFYFSHDWIGENVYAVIFALIFGLRGISRDLWGLFAWICSSGPVTPNCPLTFFSKTASGQEEEVMEVVLKISFEFY